MIVERIVYEGIKYNDWRDLCIKLLEEKSKKKIQTKIDHQDREDEEPEHYDNDGCCEGCDTEDCEGCEHYENC